jgi:hypothetical protein
MPVDRGKLWRRTIEKHRDGTCTCATEFAGHLDERETFALASPDQRTRSCVRHTAPLALCHSLHYGRVWLRDAYQRAATRAPLNPEARNERDGCKTWVLRWPGELWVVLTLGVVVLSIAHARDQLQSSELRSQTARTRRAPTGGFRRGDHENDRAHKTS